MTDFYVTVPSNLDDLSYPTDFTVRLPEPLQLSMGTYECGLHEILFAGEMQNVTESQEIVVHYRNGRSERLLLPSGNYRTNQSLVAALNSLKEIRGKR